MTSTKIAMASLSQSPITSTGNVTAKPTSIAHDIDHQLELLWQAQVNHPQIRRLEMLGKPKSISHDID
jgi:hypothetical protein